MKFAFLSFMIVMTLLALSSASFAVGIQERKRFSKIVEVDGFADAIQKQADDNIMSARGADGKFLMPLDAAERHVGVISPSDANIVIDRGIFSAYAAWCGFDWENDSFLAFMGEVRESRLWNDRQVAYIGLLHGMSMGFMEKQMKKIKGGCKPDDYLSTEKYFKYLANANAN